MSRKRKANIQPSDIGTYYTDGKGVYQLKSCDTEPMATMQKLGNSYDPVEIVLNISEFADFVRLKPEREIPKPETPRKQRADAGGHHKVKPGRIDIEKIKIDVGHDDQLNMATYKDIVASNPTLRGAVLDLFVSLGIVDVEKVIEYIQSQPASYNKTIFLDALGG